MTPDQRIAELEAERDEISNKCRANAEQRQALKDEYDALINRRLEAQKEINGILQQQIAEMEANQVASK